MTVQTPTTAQDVERQTRKLLDRLRRELADTCNSDQVGRVGRSYYEHLSREATVTEFIPVLVYRYTKDELAGCEPDELHEAV
jgi:hypothetical protein